MPQLRHASLTGHLDFTDAPLEEPWRLLSGHPEALRMTNDGRVPVTGPLQRFTIPGLVNIQNAIENDHRKSGFSQLENGDFPVVM